jgi:hypothetical protein
MLMKTLRTFGYARSSVFSIRGSMSTGGTLLMDAGLTMAQRALFQWGLFWLVALTLMPTLEFPQPPFKKYLDTCK